jgi:hypothetical protein
MWRLSAKTVSAENGGVICEKRWKLSEIMAYRKAG